jgi:hypothetical protein
MYIRANCYESIGNILHRNAVDDLGQAVAACTLAYGAKGVSEPVLARALEYWHKVDEDLGERIAARMNDR